MPVAGVCVSEGGGGAVHAAASLIQSCISFVISMSVAICAVAMSVLTAVALLLQPLTDIPTLEMRYDCLQVGRGVCRRAGGGTLGLSVQDT